MRDIEKLIGCIRLVIIYLGSGVVGNLVSFIFFFYYVEVIFLNLKLYIVFILKKFYWCIVDFDIICKNILFVVKLVYC